MKVNFKFEPGEKVILNCVNGNKYPAEIHKCMYDTNGISYEIITARNKKENQYKPLKTTVIESFLTKLNGGFRK